MSAFWVLVADESIARIFASDKIRVELEELEVLTNPEARMHEHELGSERKGRGFESANPGRHALEPSSDIRSERLRQFVRTITSRLARGLHEHAYERLIVVAPPALLGLLRRQLPTTVEQGLERSLDMNIARESPAGILRHLHA